MRKILSLLSLCVIIASCSDDDNEIVILSGTNIMVEAVAAVTNYQLTANTNWRIEGDTDWCVVNPKSGGVGLTELTFDIKANLEENRSAEFKVVASNNQEYASIVVNQKEAISSAQILSFAFLAKNNSGQLITDVYMEMKDYKITGRVPYYSDLSSLVATIEFTGEELYVDEVIQVNSETANDFTKEIVYKVQSKAGKQNTYHVSVANFTGLPVVFVSTNGVEIADKENWVEATMNIDGAGKYESVSLEKVSIRGRGNSTWIAPKKPYAIKLDKKVGLFGMPTHKRWVLLANYYDATSLRNKIGFDLGEKYTELGYTPRMEYVELFLNDVYMGVYQFGEHIKIDENRVNITDDGYLIEVDAKAAADEVIFRTPITNLIFNVKEPEIETGGDRYQYIKDYISNVETILYGDDFLNKETGYRKYIDINSFVDWYLINEITKNNDAVFFTSCFMNLKPGEKLKMGPLWDFDIAFGNFSGNEDPRGFWIKYSPWIRRMFEDPEFVDLVKIKFEKIAAMEDEIMQNINNTASYLQWSIIENNAKWGTLYQYTWANHAIWGSYNNEVQFMKKWINERMSWLSAEYAKL